MRLNFFNVKNVVPPLVLNLRCRQHWKWITYLLSSCLELIIGMKDCSLKADCRYLFLIVILYVPTTVFQWVLDGNSQINVSILDTSFKLEVKHQKLQQSHWKPLKHLIKKIHQSLLGQHFASDIYNALLQKMKMKQIQNQLHQ